MADIDAGVSATKRQKLKAANVPGDRLVVNGRKLKSLLDERAWLYWMPLVRPDVDAKAYEALTLNLQAGRYTPSIMVLVMTKWWLVDVRSQFDPNEKFGERTLSAASVEFPNLARYFVLVPKGEMSWRMWELHAGQAIECDPYSGRRHA